MQLPSFSALSKLPDLSSKFTSLPLVEVIQYYNALKATFGTLAIK